MEGLSIFTSAQSLSNCLLVLFCNSLFIAGCKINSLAKPINSIIIIIQTGLKVEVTGFVLVKTLNVYKYHSHCQNYLAPGLVIGIR